MLREKQDEARLGSSVARSGDVSALHSDTMDSSKAQMVRVIACVYIYMCVCVCAYKLPDGVCVYMCVCVCIYIYTHTRNVSALQGDAMGSSKAQMMCVIACVYTYVCVYAHISRLHQGGCNLGSNRYV
jgi:hypothetical protein